MNRIAKLAILVFVACAALPGQEKAASANPSVVKTLSQEVFLVKHRDPAEIVKIINFLGSGSKDALMEANTIGSDIRTITVRDFVENFVAIKAVIEKLDIPLPESTPVEVTMNVIWASKKDMPGNPVSSNLTDVVNEISKTLNYKFFREAAVITHTTKNNSGYGRAMFGTPGYKDGVSYMPIFHWGMVADNSNFCNECILSARFNIVYGRSGHPNNSMEIKDAFVNLKNDEKILLGTSMYDDFAMIIVVSARAVSGF
jgi:hypothetical protein